MGNKQEELEVCVQLQGYDLTRITEMCWDSSHNWSAAMDGYKLFRKDRLGRQGGETVLYMRQQLGCMELCLGMDDVPVRSLWVRIRGQTDCGGRHCGGHLL